MFRKVAVFACLLAAFWQIIVPNPALAGSCGVAIVHTPVQIERAVVAVPQIFFQIVNPTPAVVLAPTIALPTVTGVSGPVESETARIDRLVRERLEAVIKEHMQGVADMPMIVDEPSVDLVAQASASLQKRCASCHTGATAKKGVVLFTDQGVFNPNVKMEKIVDVVSRGVMPPAAKGDPRSPAAVPAAEIAVLRQLHN